MKNLGFVIGQGVKLVFLGLTLWPILYLSVNFMSGHVELFASLSELMAFHLISILIIICISPFYLIGLFHNSSINQKAKLRWLLLLLFIGLIGNVFYWKRHIW